ncbi:hypothetical protein QR680_011898 [Steinernema hermaphroditum]|uniref:Uncharacterized protein n=1 Tax=Steinernema hermaphroditum TaxID=289476 RepID=A0AA39I060_9BILA|nr:hypothetical protein QR680_011898 [Steinernema hermaphroditum]
MLPYVNWCYNTTVDSTTGEPLFYLMFGRDSLFALDHILNAKTSGLFTGTDTSTFRTELTLAIRDAWDVAKEHSEAERAKNKERYDKSASSSTIQIGDQPAQQECDTHDRRRAPDLPGILATRTSPLSPVVHEWRHRRSSRRMTTAEIRENMSKQLQALLGLRRAFELDETEYAKYLTCSRVINFLRSH